MDIVAVSQEGKATGNLDIKFGEGEEDRERDVRRRRRRCRRLQRRRGFACWGPTELRVNSALTLEHLD